MRVEVITPEDYMGDVIGDLNSRRGQVSTTDKRGNATVISAMVPLANMFGYINNLGQCLKEELSIQCFLIITQRFHKMFRTKLQKKWHKYGKTKY